MEKYDYKKAVKDGILRYLREQRVKCRIDPEFEDILLNKMEHVDYITGPGPRGKKSREYAAEECLCHNFGLLATAYMETDTDEDLQLVLEGAGYCDRLVRSYLLGRLLPGIIREWNLSFPPEKKSKNGKKGLRK